MALDSNLFTALETAPTVRLSKWNWVKKVNDVWFAVLDDSDLLRKTIVRFTEGRKAMLLGRPVRPHLLVRILLFSVLFLRLCSFSQLLLRATSISSIG